jgi:hypothetical protein
MLDLQSAFYWTFWVIWAGLEAILLQLRHKNKYEVPLQPGRVFIVTGSGYIASLAYF